MNRIESILLEAKSLTLNEQLTLASLIIQQSQELTLPLDFRRDAFRRVRGMFKDDDASEEFRKEKLKETDLEEMRYRLHFNNGSEKKI